MSFCYSTTNRQHLSVLSGKLPVPLLPAGHVVCLKVLQIVIKWCLMEVHLQMRRKMRPSNFVILQPRYTSIPLYCQQHSSVLSGISFLLWSLTHDVHIIAWPHNPSQLPHLTLRSFTILLHCNIAKHNFSLLPNHSSWCYAVLFFFPSFWGWFVSLFHTQNDYNLAPLLQTH